MSMATGAPPTDQEEHVLGHFEHWGSTAPRKVYIYKLTARSETGTFIAQGFDAETGEGCLISLSNVQYALLFPHILPLPAEYESGDPIDLIEVANMSPIRMHPTGLDFSGMYEVRDAVLD